MMDLIRDNWLAVYAGGGLIAGGLGALAAFIVLWVAAAVRSRTWGILFGWIPGAVAACVAAPIVGFLWPLILLGLLLGGGALINLLDDLLEHRRQVAPTY